MGQTGLGIGMMINRAETIELIMEIAIILLRFLAWTGASIVTLIAVVIVVRYGLRVGWRKLTPISQFCLMCFLGYGVRFFFQLIGSDIPHMAQIIVAGAVVFIIWQNILYRTRTLVRINNNKKLEIEAKRNTMSENGYD